MNKGKYPGRKTLNRLLVLMAIMITFSMAGTALAYAGQSIKAVKAGGEVVIDGELNEWNTLDPMVANTMEQVVRDVGQWTGPEDSSFEVYVMWDEKNLYLAAKILDETPFMYREGFPPDFADSLVIFLSTDPGADPARTSYTARDFRMTQIIDDYDFYNGIDRSMIADPLGYETSGEDGDMQVLEGFSCAVKEIEGGYTYESCIPLANFSNDKIPLLVPEAGMRIGFECALFDLDFPCPGVATVRIQACGSEEADTNPSLWGSLEFVVE